VSRLYTYEAGECGDLVLRITETHVIGAPGVWAHFFTELGPKMADEHLLRRRAIDRMQRNMGVRIGRALPPTPQTPDERPHP